MNLETMKEEFIVLVNDKVIVVTGGGGGIGRQLVLQLLQKGAKVATVDISQERLNETYEKANRSENLMIHVLDITKLEAVKEFLVAVKAKFGAVDGLINNAGIIQPFVPVKDLEYKKINQVMDVNFYGPLYMIKTFLPEFLSRPEAHIMNVSSMGGFFPFPGQSIYGASKAALKLMTEGLYAELLNSPVKVGVVFPGAIATDISKNSGVAMEAPKGDEKPAMKMTLPEKAAEEIIKAMEKNRFQTYVGSDSKMMKMMYKLSPKRAISFITKMMAKM